jgi:predicted enzyme related to lactoylglutathione lyase
MEKTPHLPGKFIWFEHLGNDLAKARAFYEPLFGWHTESMPVGGRTYQMLLNDAGGVGGLWAAQPGVPPHWMSYMSVDDVDKSHRAALAAGATETLPPTDFPPVGRASGLKDPTGAAFSLWTSANGDPPDGDVPLGGFVWNELSTPDAAVALAFYERAFGYTHDTMDMGEQGQYHLLKSANGQSRAGLYQPKAAGTPAMWLPYVHVSDCDATVAKAQLLGARQMLIPPMDVPNVGRIAAFIDPLGAAIAVIKPMPMQGAK